MSVKRLIISLLIISHLLINCAWASIHSTDHDEGMEAVHLHVEAAQQHSDNNSQDESCHVHLSCQLPHLSSLTWAFQSSPAPQYKPLDYRSLAEQPPVPPPTI